MAAESECSLEGQRLDCLQRLSRWRTEGPHRGVQGPRAVQNTVRTERLGDIHLAILGCR